MPTSNVETEECAQNNRRSKSHLIDMEEELKNDNTNSVRDRGRPGQKTELTVETPVNGFQDKNFASNNSSSQDMIVYESSHPRNKQMAYRLKKEKTPFKNRFLLHQTAGTNGLNETSVEVLKLDASEFTLSDKDHTKSNLITLRSEEVLAEANTSGINRNQTKSPFKYTSLQGGSENNAELWRHKNMIGSFGNQILQEDV